ncbi:MAG: hypothetical protein ACK4N5_04180, partial [Myxococcales bacterium]
MVRLLSCLLLAVLAGACGEDPPCARGTGVSGIQGAYLESPPSFAVQGEELAVPFAFGTMTSCQDTAEARVVAEDGSSVPAVVTLDRPNEAIPGFFLGGTIRFAPAHPGVNELRITVLPAGHVTVVPILVARDRTGEARREVPLWCQRMEATGGGALICDDKVLRDGAEVQTLASRPVLAASGRHLWVYSVDTPQSTDGRLERFEDRGSGALVRTPMGSAKAPCCAAEHLFAPAADEAFVLSARLERFVPATLGIESEGRLDNPPQGARYLLRTPEHLVTVHGGANDFWYACRYRPAQMTLVPFTGPAGQQFNGCQQLRGSLAGIGDGGLWVSRIDGQTLTLEVFVPGPEGMNP